MLGTETLAMVMSSTTMKLAKARVTTARIIGRPVSSMLSGALGAERAAERAMTAS